jgi:glycosyltransferase involved in cell wall biosynthesis
MNIAIFPSAFYPSLGGVEELVRQLAHQLKRDGHKVMIATNRWPKSIPGHEDVEGLDVHRYVCRVPEHTWRQMGGALLYGPGTLRSVCADLRAFDAEVVHVQCVSSSAYYAMNAARRLKLPFVATLQGELTMDASRVFQRSRFAQKLMRNVLTTADAVTGCSEHTLAEGASFFGKPFGSRGRAVPNGVLCSDFQAEPFPHPRPYIFAIGRHAPQKGFDNLFTAFARIVQDPRNAEMHDLLIAGEGPETETLQKLACELRLGDRLKFVGRKNHAEAVALFLGCSFFVLSSRADEGLPVVSVEALAAGAPIVATCSGGTPEAVQNGVNGLIVPKDDVDALEAGMRNMASDPALRQRMRAANVIRAREYDWSSVARQYVSVYEQAIQHRKASGS